MNASALASDTCASPSAFIADVQNLVRTAAGLPVPPTGQAQGSGICMPDLLKLVNGANLTWFDAQLNTSGLTGQTSVNGLAEYAKLAGEQGHPCGDDVMTQLSATSFSLVVTLTVGGPSAAGFGATQRGQIANAVAKVRERRSRLLERRSLGCGPIAIVYPRRVHSRQTLVLGPFLLPQAQIRVCKSSQMHTRSCESRS